jgi:fibronectin type 3 domain-containing protein
MLLITLCLSDILFTSTAKADETSNLSYVIISNYPSKTIYAKGENLDLSDLVLTGYYVDGTSTQITDYNIMGYDSSLVGSQTVNINYQNFNTSFNVTVIPARITNISVSSHSTSSHTLTWDAAAGNVRYEVYMLDDYSGLYNLFNTTYTNNITLNYLPGTVHSYKVCTVENLFGIDYRGELSDPFSAATDPEPVTSLAVTQTAPTSVSLTWTPVSGATGYLIYRTLDSKYNYVLCGETNVASYTDPKLSSGQGYQYKVAAYTLNHTFQGGVSNIVDTSTTPAKLIVKYKAGDQKVKITWPHVTGATSYDVYIADETNGFTLLTTKNSSGTYIAEGLTTGRTYSFYAVAHRDYKGTFYDSPASDLKKITMEAVPDTSTEAKYFKTEARFFNSNAFNYIPFFSQYVDYTKSFVIPGLINTNVNGFASTSMTPQGITFAKKYLLVTAYDQKSEENSVIYVMDKITQELLTTLILPSKTHAGGICFDGINVWIPTGTKLSTIPYSEIDEAAQSGNPFTSVSYSANTYVDTTVSFLTYYDHKLWAGSYDELMETNLYSYTIEDKETEPYLIQADTIVLPTRVQGIAFTTKGTLILSRSCQLYKGLRGYMRQLDLYKPDFANATDGMITLGESINTVEMPSMNEGIAISGSYLYVNYESAAFDKASYKMDRICAFKLSSLTKKIVSQ